jgi:diaminopimelate epimerase
VQLNKADKRMNFYKLQASGNDFILLDVRNLNRRLKSGSYKKIALCYCRRKLGIGADGLLVIESSKRAAFKMRIFNADGTEAEMCGNGARCAGLWALNSYRQNKKKYPETEFSFESKAGVIGLKVVRPKEKGEKFYSAQVKVKLTDPCGIRLDLPLVLNKKRIKVNYLNTGVPHAVVFVQGLDDIEVNQIGSRIRFHKKFRPKGTNVDFVEFQDKDVIRVRTYERGVEAETLACGTGVAASAVAAAMKIYCFNSGKKTFKVITKTQDVLKVHFNLSETKINDLWLEGKSYLVYEGRLNIC